MASAEGLSEAMVVEAEQVEAEQRTWMLDWNQTAKLKRATVSAQVEVSVEEHQRMTSKTVG